MRVQHIELTLSDGRTVAALIPDVFKEGDGLRVTKIRVEEGYEDASICSYEPIRRAFEPLQ